MSINTEKSVEICDLCDRAKDDVSFCSEFCAQTSQEEKDRYLAMKDGDFGLYPCEACGCIIEDQYDEARPFCGDAHCRGERLRVKIAKLKSFIETRCLAYLPLETREEIEKLLNEAP